MGRALWMATIAMHHDAYGILPFEASGPTMLKVAHRIARETLEGAGVQATDRVSTGRVTLIYRRQCAEHERAQVPEPYLQAGVDPPTRRKGVATK